MEIYAYIKQLTGLFHFLSIVSAVLCMHLIIKKSFIDSIPSKEGAIFSIDKYKVFLFVFCLIFAIINIMFLVFFYDRISILYYKTIFPAASIILMFFLSYSLWRKK